jgi:hypothetical protein
MKGYGTINVVIHIFLNFALVGGVNSLPLCPRRKSPRYLLDRIVGGPQGRSGKRGEEKILDPTETRTPSPKSFSP